MNKKGREALKVADSILKAVKAYFTLIEEKPVPAGASTDREINGASPNPPLGFVCSIAAAAPK